MSKQAKTVRYLCPDCGSTWLQWPEEKQVWCRRCGWHGRDSDVVKTKAYPKGGRKGIPTCPQCGRSALYYRDSDKSLGCQRCPWRGPKPRVIWVRP